MKYKFAGLYTQVGEGFKKGKGNRYSVIGIQ